MAVNLDRASIWIVLIIILCIIVMSVYQIRSTLKTPQRLASNRLAAVLESESSLQNASEQTAQIQADQSRDDDGDGLNNFEEAAQYGTSPYLVDTDSDTKNDAEEIAAGTDPTCPEGEQCQVAQVAGDGTTTEAQKAFDELTPTLTGDDTETISREQMEGELSKRGVTKEQLAEMTDQEVSDLYLEAQQEATVGLNSITNVEQSADVLLNLSVADKRKLLIDSGVASTEVDKLSDEQVNTLIQEAVDTVIEQQGTQESQTQEQQ